MEPIRLHEQPKLREPQRQGNKNKQGGSTPSSVFETGTSRKMLFQEYTVVVHSEL